MIDECRRQQLMKELNLTDKQLDRSIEIAQAAKVTSNHIELNEVAQSIASSIHKYWALIDKQTIKV